MSDDDKIVDGIYEDSGDEETMLAKKGFHIEEDEVDGEETVDDEDEEGEEDEEVEEEEDEEE